MPAHPPSHCAACAHTYHWQPRTHAHLDIFTLSASPLHTPTVAYAPHHACTFFAHHHTRACTRLFSCLPHRLAAWALLASLPASPACLLAHAALLHILSAYAPAAALLTSSATMRRRTSCCSSPPPSALYAHITAARSAVTPHSARSHIPLHHTASLYAAAAPLFSCAHNLFAPHARSFSLSYCASFVLLVITHRARINVAAV